MKRNPKALGLALVAALAMSAFAANAAMAEDDGTFTAAEYPAAITGHEEGETGENYLTLTPNDGAPQSHCEDVVYEATLEGASHEITVTPHFTNCVITSSIGNLTTAVDLNGCDVVLFAEPVEAEVVCPEGEQIELTMGPNLCVTDIPPQRIENGITFTNVANGDVTVDVNVEEEITYTETDTSIFCPNTSPHHTSNGSFVANILLTGFEDEGAHHWTTTEEHLGEVVGETTKETLTEGAALDIDVG